MKVLFIFFNGGIYMPFTNKQLITLSSAIETCFHICNKPDKSNNIEIKNNIISLILNDSIIFQNEIDVISLKEKLQKISYRKNIFQQKDSPFNPLEADRKENKIVWRKDYSANIIHLFQSDAIKR